jgi:GntR family transcriptional regulator/MocR family aminotransferase
LSRHQFDLPVVVERHADLPLSVQVGRQLREAMNDGRVRAGERLPSSRALASALGVSRTVVTAAYEQLYAEGWLEGRHGSGTYVADIAANETAVRDGAERAEPGRPADAPTIDLRPGTPWVDGLDTPAWRRAWRLAATVIPVARPDPRGLPGLRTALVDYLRRSRGVACSPGHILVTRGATNGLDLLAATVVRPGDRVGVEEPGYPTARAVLAARGAEVVRCPVDKDGLVVDALPDGLRLVYTTPSHQYPLGGRLPVPRRQALLAWARRNGALIAEDDYDSEFRYDVAPLPALYGMGPDLTIYLGTTSKTLAPGLGAGWLVARPDLVDAVAHTRERLSDRTAVVPQEAVRILLERGDLDRHVRRMRAEYARRRVAVVESLGHLPLWGDTAGLHLVVELPAGVVDRVVDRAAEHGVLLASLEERYASTSGIHGLVIGYGGATAAQIRSGCSLVRELVRAAVREPAPTRA